MTFTTWLYLWPRLTDDRHCNFKVISLCVPLAKERKCMPFQSVSQSVTLSLSHTHTRLFLRRPPQVRYFSPPVGNHTHTRLLSLSRKPLIPETHEGPGYIQGPHSVPQRPTARVNSTPLSPSPPCPWRRILPPYSSISQISYKLYQVIMSLKKGWFKKKKKRCKKK
jgi:hypothetical protein